MLQPGSKQIVWSIEPDCNIFDGGPAKVEQWDREWFDKFEARFGKGSIRSRARSSGRGMQIMEADWVATDQHLFYVNPALGLVTPLRWDELTVTKGSTKWRFQHLTLHSERTGSVEMSLGKMAATSLLAIAARQGASVR